MSLKSLAEPHGHYMRSQVGIVSALTWLPSVGSIVGLTLFWGTLAFRMCQRSRLSYIPRFSPVLEKEGSASFSSS